MNSKASDPMAAHERQTRTCLFTDIVGSTDRTARLDDATAKRLLTRTFEIFRECLPSHDVEVNPRAADLVAGKIVADTGDGVFADFVSITDAVETALKFQWRMAEEKWEPERIEVRMGIDTGDVTFREDAAIPGREIPFGNVTNRAARVMSFAVGGQILITQGVDYVARQKLGTHPFARHVAGEGPELFYKTLGWMRYHGDQVDHGDAPLQLTEVGAKHLGKLVLPTPSEKCWPCDSNGHSIQQPRPESKPFEGMLVPGNTGGAWVLERSLGRGGFGEAWLAQNRDRRGSYRVFKFPNDPHRVRSFFREEKLATILEQDITRLTGLHHVEGIVKVVGLSRESPMWIATDYYPEGSLADWAANNPAAFAALPLTERLRFVIALARIVHTAHEVGIIHKDIKPSNVFIRKDALGFIHPVLADFGIGCIIRQELLEAHGLSHSGLSGNPTLTASTRTGTAIYTPREYEKLGAKPTVKGDVYALGVMLYQLVIGDLSQPHESAGECRRRVRDELLSSVINKAVDAESARFASAEELARSLERLNEQRQRVRLKRRLLMVAGAVAVISALCFGYELWNTVGISTRSATPPPAAFSTPATAALNDAASEPSLKEVENKPPATSLTPSTNAIAGVQPEPHVSQESSFIGRSAGEKRTFEIAPGISIQLCWCPAGQFTMGSPKSEVGRFDWEDQVDVTLSHGFWIAVSELTRAQWSLVTGQKPLDVWSSNADSSMPVDWMTWDEARYFCESLNSRRKLPEGWSWSMPTEAQWEYACRAGKPGLYGAEDFTPTPEPGSSYGSVAFERFLANSWGICGMNGSVWEWCLDGWDGVSKLPGGTDPLQKGLHRVVRGGGDFRNGSHDCRSAGRAWFSQDNKSSCVGLRLAVVMTKLLPPNAFYKNAFDYDERERRLSQNSDKSASGSAPNQASDGAGKQMIIKMGGDDMAFRWCPPGSFVMGSSTLYGVRRQKVASRETYSFSDERQHQVTLTKGFWIAETEVTETQWPPMSREAQVVRTDGSATTKISWDEAVRYCAAANEVLSKTQSQLQMRLPTEAEWEYACRAGCVESTYAGDHEFDVRGGYNRGGYSDVLDRIAWVSQNHEKNPSHRVGLKAANNWGLFDMLGNVSEWCLDWYGDYPSEAVTDPLGPATGKYRITRGGDWSQDPLLTRAAARLEVEPSETSDTIGFRPVLIEVDRARLEKLRREVDTQRSDLRILMESLEKNIATQKRELQQPDK